MRLDELRPFCLSLPNTTENVQWGNDLLFKVGGKMYACAGLEPGVHWLSFKSSPENFAELIERQGVAPAAYLARAHWVAIERNALSNSEVKNLVRQAYEIVFAKLPKRTQRELSSNAPQKKSASKTSAKKQTKRKQNPASS